MNPDIQGIPRETRPLKELLKLRQYINEIYDEPDLPAIINGMIMEASATSWIALDELPPILQITLEEAEELHALVNSAYAECFEGAELVDEQRFKVLSSLSGKIMSVSRNLSGE